MEVVKSAVNMQENCEVCYQIKCKNCGWEPDEVQVEKVLKGELKICPDCGASPH